MIFIFHSSTSSSLYKQDHEKQIENLKKKFGELIDFFYELVSVQYNCYKLIVQLVYYENKPVAYCATYVCTQPTSLLLKQQFSVTQKVRVHFLSFRNFIMLSLLPTKIINESLCVPKHKISSRFSFLVLSTYLSKIELFLKIMLLFSTTAHFYNVRTRVIF